MPAGIRATVEETFTIAPRRRLAPAGGTPPPDIADAPEFPLDVPAAFLAGALLGVATDWLQRGYPRTPLEMTTLTKPQMLALRATVTPPHTSQGPK